MTLNEIVDSIDASTTAIQSAIIKTSGITVPKELSSFAAAISKMGTAQLTAGALTGTSGKSYTLDASYGITSPPQYIAVYSYNGDNSYTFTWGSVPDKKQWTFNYYSGGSRHTYLNKAFGNLDTRALSIMGATDTSITFYIGTNMSNYMKSGANNITYVVIGQK